MQALNGLKTCIARFGICLLWASTLAGGSALAETPVSADQMRNLHVAVVYNDDAIQIRYRYPIDEPSWYHQVWRYTDGDWVRHGSGSPDADPAGLYEDRISMMLADDSVPEFMRLGGFMTAHEGMRSLDSAVDAEDVRSHPLLGEAMGRSDVRKYIPRSRNNESEAAWDDIRAQEELEAMRKRGEFLDLWQWRAHRSNPVGKADNGYVLHYRMSSEGLGSFTTNWDDESGQPAWMFDPEVTGFHALSWDRLLERGYGQDDYYFLSEDHAIAFNPDHEWQEGDVIPQRFLREPSGSRGAILAEGRHDDGAWHVVLTRSLKAPDPTDSLALEPGGEYTVAFAVHEGQGARWHHVSMPIALRLDDDSEPAAATSMPRIMAQRVDGDLSEAVVEYTRVELISPGQITRQWLHGAGHPGQTLVRDTEIGFHDVAPLHPLEQLVEWISHHERTGDLPEDAPR